MTIPQLRAKFPFKPYLLALTRLGAVVEVISFPWLEPTASGEIAYVMARTTPGDPASAIKVRCQYLRLPDGPCSPIRFNFKGQVTSTPGAMYA